MPLVVGVSFKRAGKIYYFDPNGIDLHEGDKVIAETARGMEFCEVAHRSREVTDDDIVSPLKKIIRIATESDIARDKANEENEKQAFIICQQKVQNHNLPMKLIEAEYTFDGSQITFFFSSESRVDFRELVKDLAGSLKTKVQLHQVGVRDEAKFYGGMGTCGRSLCCVSFLDGFEPVSMKMAKEQSLFLNPLKFSGICGKLMCCLKYEYEMYKEVKSRLPAIGTDVITPKGQGRVADINVVKETITVCFDEGIFGTYTLDDLEIPDIKKECCDACPEESEEDEEEPNVSDFSEYESVINDEIMDTIEETDEIIEESFEDDDKEVKRKRFHRFRSKYRGERRNNNESK